MTRGSGSDVTQLTRDHSLFTPSPFGSFFEHLEHALGHGEAAEDVDRGERDGNGAQAEPEIDLRRPAARIAPTMITLEIALVTLISGVCSAGVTFQITW